MVKTAAAAFPITLFLAWCFYVVTRAGNGPGLDWSRVPRDTMFAGILTGVPYLLFLAIALGVLYVTRIRGQANGATTLMGTAVARFAVVYLVAVVAGATLGEWYCLADERAFRRETREHNARSLPDPVTRELPLYSRKRWWPGSSQLLVSPIPPPIGATRAP